MNSWSWGWEGRGRGTNKDPSSRSQTNLCTCALVRKMKPFTIKLVLKSKNYSLRFILTMLSLCESKGSHRIWPSKKCCWGRIQVAANSLAVAMGIVRDIDETLILWFRERVQRISTGYRLRRSESCSRWGIRHGESSTSTRRTESGTISEA